MKYVRYYLIIVGFNMLISFLVCVFFPNYRYYFYMEDSLIENLSAAFFLLSFILAILLVNKRTEDKKILILISVLGLFGFLDEISFGERFFKLSMPYIDSVKIDAVHDFIFLAYKKSKMLLQNSSAIVLVFILMIALLIFRNKLSIAIQRILHKPHQIIFLLFFVFVFFATLIDLDIVRFRPLFYLEEQLEMNAAIALIFCCLSLERGGQPSEAVAC